MKVGGSLFLHPKLGERLLTWIQGLKVCEVVLVPGGGGCANVIREFDRVQELGEEHSHWLALRAMSLNAHFLLALLPEARVVTDTGACASSWDIGKLPILDAYAFVQADEGRPGALPHDWTVSSDSVAARFAILLRASSLILLKSAPPPAENDWKGAARTGYVDEYFDQAIASGLQVEAVDFHAWCKSQD